MNSHNREIALVQNPGIGALALWRFSSGYYSTKSLPTPFPLLFIVLPVVFRSDLRKVIIHTYKSSGLSKFAEKLAAQRNTDQLYSIHHAAEQYKLLTLKSLHVAEAAHLLSVEVATAHVIPLLNHTEKIDNTDTHEISDSAEKLGFWCSNLTIHELSNMIKVRF